MERTGTLPIGKSEMRRNESAIALTGNKNSLQSMPGSTSGNLPELSGDLQNNLNSAASVAMNSLTESAELLLGQMRSTADPKTLIESANALASTVQVQVNMARLAKSILDGA